MITYESHQRNPNGRRRTWIWVIDDANEHETREMQMQQYTYDNLN